MNLRTAMPITAAWIDELREAFGRDGIDAAIRGGMAGVPGFWATEGGRTVGTRYVERGREVCAAQMVIIQPEKETNGNRKPGHR